MPSAGEAFRNYRTWISVAVNAPLVVLHMIWENAMKLPRRKFLHLAAGAAALPVMPRVARGQAYPTRPVRLIVPYPAGGGADTIARLVGGRLGEMWGQQVVIENRGGAGGNIASGSRRTFGTGWLHALSCGRIPIDQPVYLFEAQLRSGRRLRAGLSGRSISRCYCSPKLIAGEKPERVHRPRQGE
jgi:hypothetical protein